MTVAAKPDISESPLALRGLTAAEAAARLERGEGNAVEQETSRSYARILVENAFTAVNIVLFAISVVLIVLGLYGDAMMTAGLIVLNVVVSVVQEGRAKRQLDQIAVLARPSATVIRDGVEQAIEPGQIVRGDLIVLHPGDQVLVDGAVARSDGLSCDESLLTGESDLIPKQLGDQVFSGTFAMTGSGVYEAQKVGAASVAQQITEEARAYRNVRTPLQHEIGLVVRVMALLALVLSVQVALTWWGTSEDISLADSVKAAAVIAALVPQGLVLMVTVAYAMAAVRMSGRGALIQRMNAVESTSHIGILCLDKTGTLTTQKLALQDVEPLGSMSEPELRRLLGIYAASTPAGNRTNEAVAAACPGEAHAVVAEIPFSSSYKWSALSFEEEGLRGTYILGAPDVMAPALVPGSPASVRAEEWTSQGMRVLLFAFRMDRPELRDAQGNPRLPSDLTPLGALCFSDELRPEARETIEGFARSGIGLKVISGDHPDTVSALAAQAGFPSDVKRISGLELDGLDDEQLSKTAQETTIFGRITPQQKERLVRALRAQGSYVAMIGDGVNDVLALKQANLAIAMRSGSQVTRSVADIVLINDSFAVLPDAFQEGQRILKGMQDIIRLFLTRTAYVALVILITALMGEQFPVTPKQNALLALLTVGIPTLGLAAWARPGVTPRRLVHSAGLFVVPAALTITAVSVTVYLFFREVTGDLDLARSALTITTVLCGVLLIPFVEPPHEAWTGGDELSGDRRPTYLAAAMLGLFALVNAVPALRDFYELETLPTSGYFLLAFVVTGWAVTLRFIWRLRLDERWKAWRASRASRNA